jgi:integrase-like protein
LLDEVRDVIRREPYSIRTKQAYVDWIKRFIIYHGKRRPREMAVAAASTVNTIRYDHDTEASDQSGFAVRNR